MQHDTMQHDTRAPHPPRLRGVALRQAMEEDQPFLFRLLADPWRAQAWSHLRPVHDEREFREAWVEWGCDWMVARFVVERNGRPVGLCFDYARAPEDGYTSVSVVLEPSRIGSGVGVLACGLFHDWLFRALPIRKIYHDVYSSNMPVLRMHRHLGSAEEAVLRGHRFLDGGWLDLHKLAIYREEWPEMRSRILGTRRRRRQRPQQRPPQRLLTGRA